MLFVQYRQELCRRWHDSVVDEQVNRQIRHDVYSSPDHVHKLGNG